MKGVEIVIGGVYSNGKNKIRKVLSDAPPNFHGQADNDCVQYEYKDARGTVRTSTMTRHSFAKWAKKRVA